MDIISNEATHKQQQQQPPPPPEEAHSKKPRGPGGGSSSGRELALPATPIRSNLARWLPRIGTAGCLGLTYWLARSKTDQSLAGVTALAFPLFGTDIKDRMFAMYMTSNLMSPFLIWTVEGYRGGNFMTPLALPSLFGAAVQVLGIQKVAPIYFICSMITAAVVSDPPQWVDPDAATAVLPATILGHVVPGILMSSLSMTFTEVSRSSLSFQNIICHLFFFSPISVSILTKGISTAIEWFRKKRNRKTLPQLPVEKQGTGYYTQEKKNKSEQSKLGITGISALKRTYAVTFLLQASHHISTVKYLATRLSTVIWGPLPVAVDHANAVSTTTTTITTTTITTRIFEWITQPLGFSSIWTLLLYTLATSVFGLYTIWELRRRGYTTSRKAKRTAFVFVTGNILCGPGASYAGLWWWREGIIAY